MQPWRRTDWTLVEWIDRAWRLERTPRHSRQVYDACARHIQRLPTDQVAVELDSEVLRSLRSLILTGHPNRFGRPSRGYRSDDWTTPALMAVNNQIARLDRIGRRNSTHAERGLDDRPNPLLDQPAAGRS